MTPSNKPGRILPREGLHVGVLGALIRSTLLNPFLILPAVLLGRYTDSGRALALRNARLFSWLNAFAALGVVRVANSWLNRRALNNGVKDRFDWSREVVLLTGGSDGIGARVVQMLAERNIKVVVLDVQPLTFERPPSVRFYTCDITSSSAIEEAASQIRSAMGNPTVLIYNAGICRGKPLLSNTDNDVDLTFSVNATSHYKLSRVFFPPMISANHGMIVTVASSAAWITASRMTEYAASKAAALCFHEGLSTELVTEYNAPRVRTVVVNPGYVRTKLFDGFGVPDGAFLAPALHVDTLAEAMVKQVLKGESGEINIPGGYNVFCNWRSFPSWMQASGRQQMNHLMKNFRGRQVAQGKQ